MKNIIILCLLLTIFFFFNIVINKENFYSSSSSSKDIKILYIIRSISKYYDTRLKAQKDTWFNFLTNNDMVLVASDSFKHKNMYNLNYSTPTGCPRNHGDGPCCSESNAIVKVFNEYDSDWIFIIDDDVYAYPPKIREIIKNYIDKPYTALGTTGCVSKGIHGFCGGGGYAFSRKALEKIVNNKTQFLLDYKKNCDKTQFCDITTADLAKQKGITLKTISDFKPWGINKNERHLIDEGKIATLHYYGGGLTKDYKKLSDKMNYLHSLFTKNTIIPNSNKNITIMTTSPIPSMPDIKVI